MPVRRYSTLIFTLTLCLGGAGFVGGCSTMHTVSAPARYIESQRPKLVRITPWGGASFFMVGARLENDTVMGFVQDPKGAIGQFRELPFDSVAKVEAQQYAHARTAAAIMGGLAVWAAITYAVVRHEDTEGGQVN